MCVCVWWAVTGRPLGPACSTAWSHGCLWRFRRRNRVFPQLHPGLQVTAGFGNSLGLLVTWAGAATQAGTVWGSGKVLELSLL